MKLYGLINRKIKDIDILIGDKDRYDSYNNVGYSDNESEILNRLGSISFKYKRCILSRSREFEVDFFNNANPPYDIVNIRGKEFKLHNPLDLIKFKIQLSGGNYYDIKKHNMDLVEIFRKINLMEYASGYLEDK